MLITRYAKIVMSLVLALFCLLVAFDNITDYGTNYLFVQHVMRAPSALARGHTWHYFPLMQRLMTQMLERTGAISRADTQKLRLVLRRP